MTFMTIFRLVQAGICAFFGYSAFIAFLVLKNYPSAILGLTSGITDSILFLLHYLFHKGTLRQWYDQTNIRIFCRYAIIVTTAGLLCLGYFTTIQIMYKKPMLPIPDSCVITIVWAFVAMRSGIFLMYYSIYYQRADDREREPRLLNEPVENPVEEGTDETDVNSTSSANNQQS